MRSLWAWENLVLSLLSHDPLRKPFSARHNTKPLDTDETRAFSRAGRTLSSTFDLKDKKGVDDGTCMGHVCSFTQTACPCAVMGFLLKEAVNPTQRLMDEVPVASGMFTVHGS